MKTKPKRTLAKFGIILIAVITLGLLVRAVFNYTTGKKLETYFEQAKAKGIPMTLGDLLPACDDVDNAAPLWKAAAALIFLKHEDNMLLGQTINTFFCQSSLDEGTRAKLNRLIGKNRRALELMFEAAGKPCFSFGDQSKRGDDMEGLVSDLVKMIQVVRLLGIDAVLQAEAGKTEEALGQCCRGMLFVRRVLDKPFLVSYLVSMANMKCLLVCLDRIVSGRKIDPTVLFSMMRDLDPQLWREEFARTCRGERILSRDELLDGARGSWEKVKLSFGNRLFYWITRPMVKSEIIRLQDRYLEFEPQARLPYYQTRDFQQKLRQKTNSLSLYERLSEMSFPDFSIVMVKEANLESFIITTRIGLACKIFKQQQGRFPENIAALVPGILIEEPLDPFTGKPFIYRLQDGGFIVYGLGSNEKDDGGRGTLMPPQLIMEKDDDITWHEAGK